MPCPPLAPNLDLRPPAPVAVRTFVQCRCGVSHSRQVECARAIFLIIICSVRVVVFSFASADAAIVSSRPRRPDGKCAAAHIG